MNIRFVNLIKQYRDNKKELDAAFLSVFKKGNFILGEQVELFEREFASYLGTEFGIGVASGTDALILSLKALGINKGDEVIIPANSYPTAFAVAAAGATIKLVDIDEKTYNINTDKIEQAITGKTRVIIPVHLYGLSCDMGPIVKLAKKYRLTIIEDAAQAHGALYDGKKAGTMGEIGCFSFYPTKNLGAFGDAGMIVTKNKKIAEIARELRVYGEKRRYESVRLGVNSRLDELQAAFLRKKLKKLDRYNKKRINIAGNYCRFLKNVPLLRPEFFDNGRHVYHLFVVKTKKREALAHFLGRNGVATEVRYPVPVHLVKSFEYLGYKKGDFPRAEAAALESLALPCYPELTKKEIERICSLVKTFFSM
ncbi:DegT/DnrJ/EryC1/StrS family aminotransferase [Candidatus Microgenomates bacterium]|nr:DegT/DnrJ/EryC1/StrS family aminotransferase [Candidatus Microgenomates bacterium]